MFRKAWDRFIYEPFKRAMFGIPWFGPVFSAVLVALLVNILTEALVTWGGLWLGWAAIGVLAVVTVAFNIIYDRLEQRRRRIGLGPIDLPHPAKHAGLIFMYSRAGTLREAIAYHQPVLEHVWLLVTPVMQECAAQAMGDLDQIAFTVHPVADLYDTQACYRIVREIYQREAALAGLSPRQIISDITGGTKPMSAGMITACIEGGYPMQHVPTAFSADGKPTGPLPPIEIRIQAVPNGMV